MVFAKLFKSLRNYTGLIYLPKIRRGICLTDCCMQTNQILMQSQQTHDQCPLRITHQVLAGRIWPVGRPRHKRRTMLSGIVVFHFICHLKKSSYSYVTDAVVSRSGLAVCRAIGPDGGWNSGYLNNNRVCIYEYHWKEYNAMSYEV